MLSVTCEDVEESCASELSLSNPVQNVSEESTCVITNESHLSLQDWDLQGNNNNQPHCIVCKLEGRL